VNVTEIELRALLPRHKCDCGRAEAIIALGYPAVAPVLGELLEWLRDCNWPVAHSIAPFLAAVGEPVIPLIHEVLRGNDDIWKYWCIDRLIMEFPRNLVEPFRAELRQFALQPTNEERIEGLDERAIAALQRLDEKVRS
jgi:Domain of unknown function (DUF5071)